MIIVGVSGGIGHGKTTFATYLEACSPRSQRWESWQVIAEVANALRQTQPSHPLPTDTAAINAWLRPLDSILQQTVHQRLPVNDVITREKLAQTPENYTKLIEYLTLMQTSPELQTGDIAEANKSQFRSLLQWLGGYLVNNLDPGVWYDELVRRMQAATDLELAVVGGVRFPGDAERLKAADGYIITIRRAEHDNLDSQDLTEREQSLITADCTINNDGTLVQLQACAAQIFQDLKANQLASNYQAASF